MVESISAEALNYLTMGIQAEISAYVFYKIGATKIGDSQAKEIMLHFAGEERKHFLILERHFDKYVRSEKWITYRDTMNREELPLIDESMGEKHVKRIDQVQKAGGMMDVLQIALELEKEAYALYSEAVKTAAASDVKDTFVYLTNFEMGHVRTVEGMIASTGK
jgi:rubrerythrin